MINQNVKEVIKIIFKRLDYNKIKWALVGSTNMKLQGIETNPRDLDIVTQFDDLQKVSEIFSDYSASSVRELESLTKYPAWEVSVKINDVEVQFISGEKQDVYVSKLIENHIIFIRLEDFNIPCFTLEAESQAYKETNREFKANLIKKFLETCRC